jgi:methylamine---glutamate N-methyltransferase subunit A
MCGIVGLFLKNPSLQGDLGRLTSLMLRELCDRGPDSAGFAIYGAETGTTTKICMVSRSSGAIDWSEIAKQLGQAIGAEVAVEEIEDHAIFRTDGAGDAARKWLIDNVPAAYVLSQVGRIEIFKGVGNPAAIMDRLDLDRRTGTHAIGHTRMATESAVTVAGSHPFSTGDDTCLVHNGSLSNHNRLREQLVRRGERFQTDNDSEVAAAYLASRMRAGDTLQGALENGLKDLDGFYTFVVGTRDGFAVIRDPIACKPAVIAETDDWVAMASEYRAIAPLPDSGHAKLWEPAPATVYAWSRAA